MRPNTRLLACVFAACALLGAVQVAGAASPAALLDAAETGLRDDLAWLADRGLIDFTLGTWPVPAGVISSALERRRPGAWSEADLDALARARASLARLDDAGALAWRANTARHPVSDAGLAVRARHEASLQVQAGSDSSAVRLRLDVQERPLARTPSSLTLDGSYAATQVADVVVALGAVDRWWGPARYASPILGNAAPAIPALLVRRASEGAPETWGLGWIGPWSYELSVGRPRHYEPRGASTLGIRLSARPLPGLEIGASRYIYWGGAGRPRSLGSLRDALLGLSNIDNPAVDGPDPSNEIAGIDLRWALPTNAATWVGYAHFVGEDEADGAPSKLIGTLGLQLKHAMAEHRLEWTLEGSDTRLGNLFGLHGDNRLSAYRHSTYVDGHYHQGLPVGAFIGGGGVLGSVGVGVLPIASPWSARYEVRLWRASVSQQGPEPINAAYGRSGKLRGWSLQAAGEATGLRWRVGLALQRYPAAGEAGRRRLGLIGGIEVPLRER